MACFTEVTTAIDGAPVLYESVAENEQCPPPKPGAKAGAALLGRTALLEFGTAWCGAAPANSCETPNTCKPQVVGSITVNDYSITSAIVNNRRECSVSANVTGTMSCNCEAP